MTHDPKLPLAVKIAYSAFMAVLVPTYWHFYGPTNFLYFCDLALILTLVGIWRESRLLVSMCAVGILAPQALWVLDFLGNLAGFHLTGMTDYMFKADSSLFLRGLSLFHGWLPFLLVYLVYRLGYDRRGLVAWSAVAVVAILTCFFLMPPPRPDAGMTPVNINYVWGMSDAAAQTMMPAWAWLLAMLAGLPVLLCAPVHLILGRVFPSPARPDAGGSAHA